MQKKDKNKKLEKEITLCQSQCLVQGLKGVHQNIINNFPTWYKSFTGYEISNITSFRNFTKWLHRPVDAAALGIFRIFLGLAMLIDISEERGGSTMDYRFGDPNLCHFPLFNFIKPVGLPLMGVLYLVMWLGAVGITVGYKFRTSCGMYLVPYWYIFLLDKPAWNNHSYLFGLCACIMFTTSANRFCSVDFLNAPRDQQVVPYWNYFIIKFQFFILYFVAGLKKLSIEWLSGYAMMNLGYHWVFRPFRTFLSVEMIELLVIHWFAAVFDFSIAFWMTWERTRLMVTPFMMSFHLMNSRLFIIGMFPWVCLAEMQLFYQINWPRTIKTRLVAIFCDKDKDEKIIEKTSIKVGSDEIEEIPKNIVKEGQQVRRRKGHQQMGKDTDSVEKDNPSLEDSVRVCVLLLYCFIQLFLPYSHFITKGYNNWTNGLYGYSWDMMVHSYDSVLTSVKIVDNGNGKVHFLEPYAFTEYDRWTKTADMAVQYAKCIERNLVKDVHTNAMNPLSSPNISIYFDIWCGMNGRFQQRVFNPNEDLLKARWSPFEATTWVLPLLNELNHMRPKLHEIENEVLSWSNYTDVMFVADFPGLTLENFISSDLDNVTITILDGMVQVNNSDREILKTLKTGESLKIQPDRLHYVTTIGSSPSCFMYTFTNQTMVAQNVDQQTVNRDRPILPVWTEFKNIIEGYRYFFYNIWNSIMFLVYKEPMPLRLREI